MTQKILPLLFLGLFVSACTTTPEQEEAPEVLDKSGSAEMMDEGSDGTAETDGEAQAFGMEGDLSAALRQLEDPESLLSVRIIYFDYDSNTVPAQFEEIIRAHAGFLRANPGVAATLEGHADERGSREYNLALGERRALAVKQQLLLLGAPAELVRTVSYGEERPADPGHDEQAWSLNRRVEFVYPK